MGDFLKKDAVQRKLRGVTVQDVLTAASETNYDEIIVIGQKDGNIGLSNSVNTGRSAMEMLFVGQNILYKKVTGDYDV